MIYVTHDQVEAMTLGDRIVIMNHGVIQQIDKPLALYQNPANHFVAGFIGSPPMNFVDGSVDGGIFQFDGGRVEVGGAIPNGLARFGVRPENLIIEGDGLPLATATLGVVEQMGHESMAYFNLANRKQVVRLPAVQQHLPGDKIELKVKQGGWHIFAADDEGRRLN